MWAAENEAARRPKNLGVWLYLLCLKLLIASPIWTAATSVINWSAAQPITLYERKWWAVIALTLAESAVALFGCVAGVPLWKRDKEGVKATKQYLSAQVWLAIVGPYFMAKMLDPQRDTGVAFWLDTLSTNFAIFLAAALWIVYLDCSKRVREVYAL